MEEEKMGTWFDFFVFLSGLIFPAFMMLSLPLSLSLYGWQLDRLAFSPAGEIWRKRRPGRNWVMFVISSGAVDSER